MAEEEPDDQWVLVNSKSRSNKTSPAATKDDRNVPNAGRGRGRGRGRWKEGSKQAIQIQTGTQNIGRARRGARNDGGGRQAGQDPLAETSKSSKQNNPDKGTSSGSAKAFPSSKSEGVIADSNVTKTWEFRPGTSLTAKTSLPSAPGPKAPVPSSSNIQLPSNSQASPSMQASEASTSDAAAKKKNRRNLHTKEVRRKRREEKFYQALYKNKDSHIQFVSADVVRKLQNDNIKPQSKSRTTALPPMLQDQSQNEGSAAESFPIPSFREFPTLATNADNRPKLSFRQAILTPSVPIAETRMSSSSDPLNSIKPELQSQKPSAPGTSKGKKSKQPLVIDVSELIVKKKDKDVDKRIPPFSTLIKPNALRVNHKVTAGNPLDSSGPGVIHRGKIRNKKKKPTKLKLTILKTRELRQILSEAPVKQGNDADNMSVVTVTKEDFPVSEDCGEISSREDSSQTFPPIIETETKIVPDIDIKDEEKVEVKCEPNLVKAEPCSPPQTASDAMEAFSRPFQPFPWSNPAPTPVVTNFQANFLKLLDEISVMKIEESIPHDIEVAVKSSMHSRKFRDYCDMYTSKELHGKVICLLNELFRFQDRMYHTDPIKFKTKRRFITGLKEALSYLNLNKVQLLLIAPDIERNPEPGGLDEKVNQILSLARASKIPYIFSGSKYTLGKPTRIKTPVSIISVLDKQNCEETYRALMDEADQLRAKYHNDFVSKAKDLMGKVRE